MTRHVRRSSFVERGAQVNPLQSGSAGQIIVPLCVERISAVLTWYARTPDDYDIDMHHNCNIFKFRRLLWCLLSHCIVLVLRSLQFYACLTKIAAELTDYSDTPPSQLLSVIVDGRRCWKEIPIFRMSCYDRILKEGVLERQSHQRGH